MSKSIKILNPIPGTLGYTSQRRADQFVRSGIAEYTRTGFMRFTSPDKQALNTMICAETRTWASKAANDDKRLYDWRGAVPVWRGRAFYKPGEVAS